MSVYPSFGPAPPYAQDDAWAQSIEQSTDAVNAESAKKEQDIENLQAYVNQMYSHLQGGKDDYFTAIMCGFTLVLFGTLTKAQDDNDLAMLEQSSTSDVSGLMSSVTELWTTGENYNGDTNSGGMTDEQGKELFEEESDLWYFLNAPDYKDTGKSMSWFWDSDLKAQITSSTSDALGYFEIDADPDYNLPLRDGDLDQTAAQVANWTNSMWYNQGLSTKQPPSQQVTTVLNDFQTESTSTNSVQTGFNSDYQTTVNTINSIMSNISDCLDNIIDLNTLSARYMAPK